MNPEVNPALVVHPAVNPLFRYSVSAKEYTYSQSSDLVVAFTK